ncbi:MAG: hypothetical protein JRN62_02520 [Nitrososphaerota archaeon]|nr:hypothetical protein [Nitrososphaerota archaeon]MDG6948876.1 hypothetical protein [Nitrososphaerota archaeon]
MTFELTDDIDLLRAKSQVKMCYAYVKNMREKPGPKSQAQVDSEAEALIGQARDMKAKIKAYEASHPKSPFMEVPHRHLVSEADRMVMKFSHLLEENLSKKIKKVEMMAKEIPGDPYAPGANPMKGSLLNEARVLRMVMQSVTQARNEFTTDSVEYHRTRLEKKLALASRPRTKRSR